MKTFWLLCVCVCVPHTFFGGIVLFFIYSFIYICSWNWRYMGAAYQKKTPMYVKRATKLVVIKFSWENCSHPPFSLAFSLSCVCVEVFSCDWANFQKRLWSSFCTDFSFALFSHFYTTHVFSLAIEDSFISTVLCFNEPYEHEDEHEHKLAYFEHTQTCICVLSYSI